MRRVFGPRTVVEAAFLIAVPVVTAAIGSGTSTIIAASGVGYLLILLLEATILREGRPAPAGLSRLRLPSRNVVVKRPEAPVPQTQPVHQAEPVLVHAPPTTPPPPVAPVQPEHVRVLRPEPEPAPAPAPVIERVPLAAVPELAPEPVLLPEPEPVVEQSTVVPIGYGAGPREWNLWELERLTREAAGADPVRDEERQFLLMYLREFADSDGQLPVDFDGLVRDSFGELTGAS